MSTDATSLRLKDVWIKKRPGLEVRGAPEEVCDRKGRFLRFVFRGAYLVRVDRRGREKFICAWGPNEPWCGLRNIGKPNEALYYIIHRRLFVPDAKPLGALEKNQRGRQSRSRASRIESAKMHPPKM